MKISGQLQSKRQRAGNRVFNRAQEMPPFLVQLGNAAGAVTRAAKTGIGKPQNVEQRWRTCARCPLFNHTNGRCSLCGCRMQWKQRLANEHCPINKW